MDELTFENRERLNSIGSSWFVSYCYYKNIDSNHTNWDRVGHDSRISSYNKTTEYHENWLRNILNMSSKALDVNKIGLSGEEVKKMAGELLEKKFRI